MRSVRRFLALFLALIMCFGLFPASVLAETGAEPEMVDTYDSLLTENVFEAEPEDDAEGLSDEIIAFEEPEELFSQEEIDELLTVDSDWEESEEDMLQEEITEPSDDSVITDPDEVLMAEEDESLTEDLLQEENTESSSKEEADTEETEEEAQNDAENEELTEETVLTEGDETEELPSNVSISSFTFVNPVYADVIDESDIPSVSLTYEDYVQYYADLGENGDNALLPAAGGTGAWHTDVERAGAELRGALVDRDPEITICFKTTSEMTDLAKTISDSALKHTGHADEGDYIRYQYGGYSANVSCSYLPGDYNYTITYAPLYYTTADQEAAMTAKVNDILVGLEIDKKTDYQKIKAIYDYLCGNVTYDYANLEDKSYDLKYTGYAALVNNTAVCQGYSVAFYRLCLEADVDARIVDSIQMSHAWNIVQLADYYYELDSTWDAGHTSYSYFLKGQTSWLSNHVYKGMTTIGDQFSDPSFASVYTVPLTDAPKFYTIAYDANGGSGAPAAQEKQHGVAVTLSSIEPVRTDYRFSGWAATKNADEAQYQPGSSFSSNSDITLYAVWEEDFGYKGSILTNSCLSISEAVYNEASSMAESFEAYCLDVLDHYSSNSVKLSEMRLAFYGNETKTVSKELWNKMIALFDTSSDYSVLYVFPDGEGTYAPQWRLEYLETATEDIVFAPPAVDYGETKFYFTFSDSGYPATGFCYIFGEDASEESPLADASRLSVYSTDDQLVKSIGAGNSWGVLRIYSENSVPESGKQYYISQSPDVKKYESAEAAYAAIREAIVKRELETGGTKFYLAGDFGVPDLDRITDFSRERAGMKPYEGDYLSNTLSRMGAGYSSDEEGRYWRFSADTITTLAQENEVDKKVAEILAGTAFTAAAASGSSEKKAKAAFDWVVSNVAGSGFDRYAAINHTGYSAFFNGYGTCEAKAVAFYRLCREMDVPCKVIMGTDSGAHTYTIIKLDDGYWYYADPSANIWKKNYITFERTTEQEKYLSKEFVQNYISKIKNYGDGTPVAEIVDAGGEVLTSESSLLNIQTALTGIIEGDVLSDTHKVYTVRLIKDVKVGAADELDYSACLGGFADPDSSAGSGYYTGADYSDRVKVNLNGHKITTLSSGDYYISVSELRNGKISMPTDSWVIIKSGNNYESEHTCLVTGVGFYGADGSKKQFTYTDALFLTAGVKVDSTCTVTGIPLLHLEDGSEFDCNAAVYALETHMTQFNDYQSNRDIVIGGTLKTDCWMEYERFSRSRTVINNLTVTKGTKFFSGADIIVRGSLNLQGRTYVMDEDFDFYDNKFTSCYQPSDYGTNPEPGITIRRARVYSDSGDYSEGSISISGILDLYELGDITSAPICFSPVCYTSGGDESADHYRPGNEIANISAKGIMKKSGIAQLAFTTEKAADFFTVKLGPNSGAYPEIENGVLYLRTMSKVLTFDPNGGYCGQKSKKIFFNSEYGILPEPLKELSTFIGWFTAPVGGEQVFSYTETAKEEADFADVTVYAHWDKRYLDDNPLASPKAFVNGTEISDGAELKAGTPVELSSYMSNVLIYYTLDGSDPDPENPGDSTRLYVEPISGDTGLLTIRAVAVKEGYHNSGIMTVAVTLTDDTDDYGTLTEEDKTELFINQGKNAADIPEGLWIAGLPESVPYRGKAVTIDTLRIYNHKTLLQAGTDYTLKYANNINAGTAKITITGKGNYSDSRIVTFAIEPLSLGDYAGGGANSENLKVTDVTMTATGKMLKGTTVAAYRIDPDKESYTALKSGKDYILSYPADSSDFASPGTHKVLVTGRGNYTGTASFDEIIIGKLSEKTLVGKLKFTAIKVQEATGSAICPEITIYDAARRVFLEAGEDKDFTVAYYNNIEAGTASAVVTGHGDYAGTKVVTFKITARPISKAMLGAPLTAPVYDGGEKLQSGYSLSYKYTVGKTAVTDELTEGVDYVVSYSNNKDASGNRAFIIFTGIGKYSGMLKKPFSITARSLNDVSVSPEELGDLAYVKGGVKPVMTLEYNGMILKEGKDYTVKYTNNAAVTAPGSIRVPTVTIIGKGNYSGKIEKTFNIVSSSLDNCRSVTAADIVYTGKAGNCRPVITVLDSNGAKLAAGADYDKNITYVYSGDARIARMNGKVKETLVVSAGSPVDIRNDIIPAGTELKAVVTGIKNYADSERTAEFRCVAANIANAKVTLSSPKGYIYSGGEIRLKKDDLKVVVNRVTLEKTDYMIVGYSSNVNKGTASITIRGIGNYGGTKTVTYRINAKSFK